MLTSTLPVTLTRSLPDIPDAATGLVHLGGGRYYDPAIGRPLQPNTAGAPPTMPQALNRYTAAAAGQPGVAQAASVNVFNWTPPTASFVYGLATRLAGEASYVSGSTSTYSGYARFKVTASHTSLTYNHRFGGLDPSVRDLFGSPHFVYSSNGRNFYQRIGIQPLSGSSRAELTQAVEELTRTINDRLVQKGPWAAQISSQIRGNTVTRHYHFQQYKARAGWGRTITVGGAGLDFALGAGFQLREDWGSPYLSWTQVGMRTGVAGAGSALSGIAGGVVGTALGTAVAAAICVPGAAVCVGVAVGSLAIGGAVGGGLAWSIWGQPLVFSSPFFRPADRNLRPLNN